MIVLFSRTSMLLLKESWKVSKICPVMAWATRPAPPALLYGVVITVVCIKCAASDWILDGRPVNMCIHIIQCLIRIASSILFISNKFQLIMNLCTTLSQTCSTTVVYSFLLMMCIWNWNFTSLNGRKSVLLFAGTANLYGIPTHICICQLKVLGMSFKQQIYNTNCLLKMIISCHHLHVQAAWNLACKGCMYNFTNSASETCIVPT